MRLLVCGPRNWDNKWYVYDILQRLTHANGDTIITGGATGVDSIALGWAKEHGVEWERYPAEWTTYGRSAGPIRNKRMLDEGKPNLVVAFQRYGVFGTVGTHNMIRQALKAGIPVLIAVL